MSRKPLTSEELREKISRQVQEYLARGGKINYVDTVVRETHTEPSREYLKRLKHSEIKRRKRV